MLYSEYINKAMGLTIVEADNGLYYLEPLWQNILIDNEMNFKVISDIKVDWNWIFNVLKLEVEKRNTENSKKPVIIDWLYELITAQIEPAILAEEIDYIKNMTEYLKTKNA